MLREEESAWHDLQVSLDERHLQLEAQQWNTSNSSISIS